MKRSAKSMASVLVCPFHTQVTLEPGTSNQVVCTVNPDYLVRTGRMGKDAELFTGTRNELNLKSTSSRVTVDNSWRTRTFILRSHL